MFTSLILAALVHIPGVPDGDRVICPRVHAAKLPPRGAFIPPLGPPLRFRGSVPVVATHVVDFIGFPTGAKWYQSYAGGADAGSYGVYDLTSHVYATCSNEDTVRELAYWKVPASKVPSQIPRRALGLHAQTEHGIRLGDTVAKVERVYGHSSLPSAGDDLWAVTYVKNGPVFGNARFVTSTTFFFRHGRLVGIERSAGI